jgi:hypothetical protein
MSNYLQFEQSIGKVFTKDTLPIHNHITPHPEEVIYTSTQRFVGEGRKTEEGHGDVIASFTFIIRDGAMLILKASKDFVDKCQPDRIALVAVNDQNEIKRFLADQISTKEKSEIISILHKHRL